MIDIKSSARLLANSERVTIKHDASRHYANHNQGKYIKHKSQTKKSEGEGKSPDINAEE